MQCPKCGHRLRVVNSYRAGNHGQTQRLCCDKCHIDATVVVLLVTVEPVRGQGAASIANKMRKDTSLHDKMRASVTSSLTGTVTPNAVS